MKGVYVDLTVDFTPEESQGYAQIMIIVASADGALVKEELAIIEGLMGRSMMHPEMRVDVRNMLENPPQLQLVMERLSPVALKAALRDAILVAAVDHHPRLLSGIVVPPGEQQDVRVDLEVVGEDEEPKIELAGIGAILQGTAEGLVINDVVDGGGAAEVGLGAGDVIVTIEGAEAADLGFGACIERLRGPEGSTVTVTVLHPGAEDPVVVVIPRRRIKA